MMGHSERTRTEGARVNDRNGSQSGVESIGELRAAWIANFIDQQGNRHNKTCKTKEAKGFLVRSP